MDRGVDGFRIDSIPFLYEDINMPDEPEISNVTINGVLGYYSLNHTYTLDQPETYQLSAEFRELLDSYAKKDGRTRYGLNYLYSKLRE